MSSTTGEASAPRGARKTELVISTFRKLPQLRVLGWGLLVAWGTISTFTDVFAPADMQSFRDYWIANMATTTLGLVGLGFLWRPSVKTLSRRAMPVAAVLIVGSTAIMAFWYGGVTLQAQMIQIAAGALSGLGMAVGTLCWGIYYARQDAAEIESQVICSLALMTICYGLALMSSWAVKIALLVALPLGSAVCFLLCQDERVVGDVKGDCYDAGSREGPSGDSSPSAPGVGVSGETSGEPGEEPGSGRALAAELCRAGVGIVAAGCAVSLTWSLISEGVVSLDSVLFAASLLSGAIVTMALLVNCVTFANRLNQDSLFRWLLPLIALSLFFLVGSSQVSRFVGSMGILAAQMGLDAFTLILFCERASYWKGRAVLVIGLGRGFLQGGILAGALMASVVMDVVARGGMSLAETFLCVAAVLTGCVMWSLAGPSSSFTSQRSTAAPGVPGNAEQRLPLPEDANELERVLFERKCDGVAERGGLSQRERELLSYLARGRSLPYIRNELFISKSTANTHVEHIYAKLGIHSREELISLVEEAPAGLSD